MTVGEVLAAVAVVIIALELWVARQARIVREEVRARRIAMEAEGQAEDQKACVESARRRRRSRRRMC
jgi:hypothetical protein